MQPAERAGVLYSPPVDELGLLQAFCEKVRSAFIEAELMVDENRPLLMHATVVNTIYVKGNNRGRGGRGGQGGRGGRGGKRGRLMFDATGIIERYEDQVWMEDVPVETVAICRMGAKKMVVNGEEDEAYEVEAEVGF
jgi:activating signal cointegrator complex subunit 1